MKKIILKCLGKLKKKKFKVLAVDMYGHVNAQIKDEIIEGYFLTDAKAIKKACKKNAEFAKIIANEPKEVDYASGEKIIIRNKNQIEEAMFVIVYPLDGELNDKTKERK